MPSGKWSHHDARYNLEMIFHNFLLVEDHFKIDPCANCLTKHLNLILAYSEEGRGLDNAKEVMGLFDEIEALVPAVLAEVLSCSSGGVCTVKDPLKMQEMVQSVRRLRRVVGGAVFGIDSDIVHDILDEEHDHVHAHDFAHEEPHEEPLSIELTEDGLEEFTHYLELRPDVLASEEHTIGINPLAHPDRYFEAELQELEHADVLQMVKRKGGLMDKNAVERWEREETAAR